MIDMPLYVRHSLPGKQFSLYLVRMSAQEMVLGEGKSPLKEGIRPSTAASFDTPVSLHSVVNSQGVPNILADHHPTWESEGKGGTALVLAAPFSATKGIS